MFPSHTTDGDLAIAFSQEGSGNVFGQVVLRKSSLFLTEWKMYSEIRSIALLKYGINLSEIDELPPATISSTSTCVEDTGVAQCSYRCIGTFGDIPSFCVRYNYNMNTQTFIERSSWAKEKTPLLNTLSIKHVSESIRTHGTGITHAS